LDEMIAATTRGLLVTRFDGVILLNSQSQLYRGYTRDGLWLIERGKISKAVKNLVFTESVIFALNNVEQVGVPQRVFHPKDDSIRTIPQPVIVPPLKVKDFSFTALTSAI
ncbi:MAG TPA: metallopeptidase TldD-related protein, partial [Gemmatimonadaceae bacterium]|nr:metallopeptidase TldD-related protein [Gemmatimonadaceae bacterium]